MAKPHSRIPSLKEMRTIVEEMPETPGKAGLLKRIDELILANAQQDVIFEEIASRLGESNGH